MSMESDPTAVMGRRIGAVFIDGAVIYIPLWVAVSSQFSSLDQVSSEAAEDYCDRFNDRFEEGACIPFGEQVFHDTEFQSHLNQASGFALLGAVILYVVLQSLTGGTIGKLITGIRVVDESGQKASFAKVLVRWLLWVVDGIPFLLGPLVGLITSLTTAGHRRVGDMVAKTYVVRRSAVGSPVVLGQYSVPPSGTWAPPSSGVPTAKPGPQWDEARGTYIQWDPEAQAWMQWDDTAKRWDPIPAAAPPIPPPPPAAPPPPPPG